MEKMKMTDEEMEIYNKALLNERWKKRFMKTIEIPSEERQLYEKSLLNQRWARKFAKKENIDENEENKQSNDTSDE